MNDLSTLTMQPTTLTIDGKDYKVHPLDLGDFGYLQEWIDRQFPNPIAIVKKTIDEGGYNLTLQQYMLKEALILASQPRHLIGTPEADALLTSVDGMKQTLYLSIRKGDPSFTEADAETLFAKMNFADTALVAQASTLDMVTTDPKADELKVTPPSSLHGVQASRRQRRANRKSTGGKSSTTR